MCITVNNDRSSPNNMENQIYRVIKVPMDPEVELPEILAYMVAVDENVPQIDGVIAGWFTQ